MLIISEFQPELRIERNDYDEIFSKQKNDNFVCSSLPLKCHDFHKEKPIGFQFCAKILEINFNIDNKFKKSG